MANSNNQVSSPAIDALSKMGVKVSASYDTARKELEKRGAVVDNLNRDVVQMAYAANMSLESADKSIRNACMIAGYMSAQKVWEKAEAPNGKPYKSENAFIKDIFPGYAISSVNNYVSVGRDLLIPMAMGEMPELTALGIDKLSPSVLIRLKGPMNDAAIRPLLPQAIKDAVETSGKLTSRTLDAAISAAKSAIKGDANPDGGVNSERSGEIANQLSGGTIYNTVETLIHFTFSDGDLTAAVYERNNCVKDFIALLESAANDADKAKAVCDALAKLAKTAK